MISSSSSSEEDLSLFQSVAVSAEDIAESARHEAKKVEDRRRSSNAGRNIQQQEPTGADAATPGTIVSGATKDGRRAPHADVRGQDGTGELDITSKRIAAALDSILARQLEGQDSHLSKQQQAAAAAASTATTAAAAADDDAAASIGVRLFKRVAPGTPCVIHNTEYGSSASIFSLRAPGAADPTACHLHPALAGQRRPFRSIKEVIPRLHLADASCSNNHKRHAEVLNELAVDGFGLIAAATAAGTAWTQLQQLQQQQEGCLKKKKKKKNKSGLSTHAALEAWKYLRKHTQDGQVVEARQFVSHDQRMEKLLRQGSTAAAATAAGN